MTAYEREFARILDAAGWAVMRAPSSGSATDRDLPDVLAAGRDPADSQRRYLMAVEHKSGADSTLYVDADEVAALERFADHFGAQTFLVARFTDHSTGTGHYLVDPLDARRTDAGTYGLPRSDVSDRATAVVREGDGIEWRW